MPASVGFFFIYEGCNSGIVSVCMNMRGAREAAAADRRTFSCSLLVFFFFFLSRVPCGEKKKLYDGHLKSRALVGLIKALERFGEG